MESVDWTALPETFWQEVFGYLDGESLLRVTETCQVFADLFASTSKLTDKIKISLNLASKRLAEQLQILTQTRRKYRNLCMFVGEKVMWQENKLKLNAESVELIGQVFGASVVNLIFNRGKLHRELFVKIFKSFPNLKVCSIINVFIKEHGIFYFDMMDDEDQGIAENHQFPLEQLQELNITRSDYFCLYFFKDSLKLKKLTIDDLGFDRIDMKYFELWLSNLKHLKDFRFRKCRDNYMFSTDVLSSPKFQLEKISLNAVYWKDIERGTAFFRSQFHLKSFEIALKNRWCADLDELMWFNDILKHVFAFNHELKSIFITTQECHGYNINNCDFLHGVVNTSVEKLEYKKGYSDETSTFMETAVKIFPNLKHLIGDSFQQADMALISSWEKLTTLQLEADEKTLNCIHITSEYFTDVILKIYKNNRKTRRAIDAFLKRHPTIQRYKIEYYN